MTIVSIWYFRDKQWQTQPLHVRRIKKIVFKFLGAPDEKKLPLFDKSLMTLMTYGMGAVQREANALIFNTVGAKLQNYVLVQIYLFAFFKYWWEGASVPCSSCRCYCTVFINSFYNRICLLLRILILVF